MNLPQSDWSKIVHLVFIKIEGQLDPKWADWLEGFTITHTAGQETVLTGQDIDQAGLYGIIAKLRDLGVKLISVKFEESSP